MLPPRVPALAFAVLAAASAAAQEVVLSEEDYLVPPPAIADVITSEAMHDQEDLGNVGPDRRTALVDKSMGMPPLEALARPYVNLGETPIDHHADRSRYLGIGDSIGFDLVDVRSGGRVRVRLPEGMTLTSTEWSPDGKHVAFMAHGEEASHLYVADVASGDLRRLSDRALNATLVTSVEWAWNGRKLLVVLVPKDRGPMPEKGGVRREPKVWVSHEGERPSRTYRFLLQTPYDKELLEYLTTGQLALVDARSGQVTAIGEPAMFSDVEVGPKGRYFRITRMVKPFSYFVPRRRFGHVEELWNHEGEVVQVLEERELRLGNDDGDDGDDGDDEEEKEPEKRSLSWRPDGKGLSFLQREPKKKEEEGEKKAADGADDKDKDAGKDDGKKPDTKKNTGKRGPRKPRTAAGGGGDGSGAQQDEEKKEKSGKRMDRVMLWRPPYGDDDVEVVWESGQKIRRVQYSDDCRTLFITQRIKGKTVVFAVDLDAPEEKKMILDGDDDDEEEGSRRRRFGGGNRLMTRRGKTGGRVVRTSSDGKHVYVSGVDRPDDPMAEAPRPYVDRIEIGSAEKERLWQSAEDVYETVREVLDDDLKEMVLERESPTQIPDSWLMERESGELKQLTANRDPAPEVTAARRERFQVERVDGLEFWVEVTIPQHHGKELPALFWFYPREYTDQESYDRRAGRHNKNRFPMVRTRSMELLTKLGYVVVDPDCPIVGERGRMNDNYVPDLRNNLWAVIDELDEREIIDRDRLAIGGHSYGAFGTANALVHTPFFKAGIAGDGNYNRTLTPMSFQRERRYVWDARETYIRMSPLLWADQVSGALLMYHGMDDNNTGTFPLHSPRMFHALDGLGKPAALYMYPYEGHGPRARETVLDLWARWVRWLDIHVKNPERSEEMFEDPAEVDITEDK